MARTWLSIRVDLVEGGGHDSIWPRPGRIFAAARSHTFAQLATAIDDAFARWDRSHLHSFDLRGTLLTGPCSWDEAPEGSQPSDRVKLSRLEPGEQFIYTFDLGDDWTHLCTVAPSRIDPVDELGSSPTCRSPTGAGAASPTSTDGGSTATTARLRSHPTRISPTCRRSSPGGEWAARRDVSPLDAGAPGERSGAPQAGRIGTLSEAQ